jgi:hypothetical protein
LGAELEASSARGDRAGVDRILAKLEELEKEGRRVD